MLLSVAKNSICAKRWGGVGSNTNVVNRTFKIRYFRIKFYCTIVGSDSSNRCFRTKYYYDINGR